MPYYIDEGQDSGGSSSRSSTSLIDLFRRVIQPIIRIIQPVIRAVQEIIQGTGGGGSPTAPVQTGSGSTEGTSGGRTDSAGRTGSQSVQSRPKKPPEYGEFDDIPAWPGVSQSRRMARHNLSSVQPASSDLREAARGSLLAQDVLVALSHEGNPSYLSNEKFLKQFARYGWDEEETEQAREVLNLWTLQQQLNEVYISFQLQLAEATGNIEVYRHMIQEAYGITINTRDRPENPNTVPALTIAALNNYVQGADMMARFYEYMYEGIRPNRYILFQAVMGEMTIIRTDANPGDKKGYAGGHTIYDRFDNVDLSRPMTATNFAHELGHSFTTFSGFGNRFYSPFYINLDLRYEAALTLLGVRRENTENDFDDPTEIFADINMAAARRDIGILGFVNDHMDIFQRAVRNAITSHLPLETYAAALGAESQEASLQPPPPDGVNIRSQPGLEGEIIGGFQNETQVTVLGNNTVDGQIWLYIAIPSGQGYTYAWVSGNYVSSVGTSLQIDPNQVDPERAFSVDDPLNFGGE